MKQFILNLLSSQSETSSKRFSALVVLFNIIAMAWVATFKAKDWITPEFMYDSLALIVGGGLGLTVLEKVFSKKNDPAPKPPVETPVDQPVQQDPPVQ